MSDSEIIWKYLDYEYPNDHLIIYLYVCGNVKTHKKLIITVVEAVKPIFYPSMTESIIKTTIEGFLDNKKKKYILGEIKVKSIY